MKSNFLLRNICETIHPYRYTVILKKNKPKQHRASLKRVAKSYIQCLQQRTCSWEATEVKPYPQPNPESPFAF